MATHPEDPKKPNAHEPAPRDPRAESARQPPRPEDIEAVVQGGGGTIEDSDSAIELGLPAGSADILSDSDLHPPVAESGINSGIAWAALMEEIPEPPADEIRVDSPSDADLLAPPPPAMGSEVTLIAPPAELSAFPPLHSGVRPSEPTPSGGPPSSVDAFEPRDIFTAEPTGRYPRPDTHQGAASERSAVPPPSDSARVDLGADTPRSSVPSGVESSIIDLGAVDFPSGDVTPSGSVEEAELASETSGIDLSAEPVSGTGSGRDLIAEALESGIKFGAPPEPSDMGAAGNPVESAIDFVAPKGTPESSPRPAAPAPSPFSSAIDFGGGSPSPDSSPFSSAIDFGGTVPPPARLETPPPSLPPPTGSAISSAIDYGGPSHSSQDSSSSVQLAPDMADDEPFERLPPTVNPTSGRPPTMNTFGGRPPTMNPESGRPLTMNPEGDRPLTMNPADDRPMTMNPADERPATMHPEGGRPKTMNPEGGRPRTMNPADNRPMTEMAMPEDLEVAMRAASAGLTPVDSEVDLGSHPSSGDFEPLEEPPGFVGKTASRPPVKTDSDSDIDINIGDLPEQAGAAGSGLFVNANSGRLEPTDATIDLDAGSVPEEDLDEAPPVAPAAPSKKIKAPSRKVPAVAGAGGGRNAWLGGSAIGVVIGGAAVFLLQFFGITGGGTTPSVPQQSLTQPIPPPPVTQPAGGPVGAPAAAVSKFDLLRNGDLDKAAQAGIEQVDENNPEQLGRRGEYRWLAYLQKQRRANGVLNAEDPGVRAAATDLQAAADKGNVDASFWLGHLQESTNAFDKAKATYAKGAGQAADPVQKRRFEAALNRLELRQGIKPAGAARAPDAAEALLLAMVALQAPAPGAAPAAAPAAVPAATDGDEAGFDFWEAARLARDQKFAEAVQALDKARASHDVRRYTRLRKPQNPLSDPTEEVFLKCVDELKAYWQLEDKLRNGGYLDVAAHRDPVKALDGLITLAKDAGSSKELVEKLAKDQEKSRADIAKLETGVKAAQSEVDSQAQKAKAAEQQLAAETTKLKAAEERATAEVAKLKMAEERERELAAGQASARDELKKLADELVKAKLLDPKADKDGLLHAVQSTIRLAAAADSQGMIRTLQAEANRFRDQLGQRWQPSEMLTYWLPILGDRGRADLATKAAVDAARVAADTAATPADKARAEAVLGLALRNQGKFTEAVAALQKAKAALPAGDAEWRERVDAALKDAADPATYFLNRADELAARGKSVEAIAELDKGEKAYPAGKAHFQAQRGLLQMETVRAKTPEGIAPTAAALQAARKDVDEAAKTGDAFALYAAGRVAEESGDYDGAVVSYRKAVAAHPARDAAGSRYRLALARVLVRASSASEAPKSAPKPGESSRAPGNSVESALLVLTLLLQVPPAAANQSEAIQLADEILAAPDSTLEMRAQALAIKGLYTQALMTYAEALRPSLTREQFQTLRELISTHPALRRPETQAVASPQDAERNYAIGLRLLYSGQYAAAEKELLAAVARDGQDARYYYFLGLARLYQGKRDALEDFEQGARLEQQGLPPGDAVNSALERVQGSPRRTIDNARGMPR
jgi:hypothetical protein